MQVNSSSGSLQQRFFSGTGSIGGIHLPSPVSGRLGSWAAYEP